MNHGSIRLEKCAYWEVTTSRRIVPLAKPSQLVVIYILLLDAFANSAQAVAFRIRHRIVKSLDPNEISECEKPLLKEWRRFFTKSRIDGAAHERFAEFFHFQCG